MVSDRLDRVVLDRGSDISSGADTASRSLPITTSMRRQPRPSKKKTSSLPK